MIKRTKSEKVSLSLSLLAAIIILPFAYLRWSIGDIPLAIIDISISCTSLIFFLFIYFTRKVETVKKAFAVFIVLALLITIYIKGAPLVYWASPAIIAVYYLMPLKLAKFVSIFLILSTVIIMYSRIEYFMLFTVFATTSLTTAMSFAIFRSYNVKEDELSVLACVDALTLAGNRRALDRKLSKNIESQYRKKHAMSLVLIDLDKFKQINDTYGHAAGDSILVSVCEIITQHTRALDSLYRYGGDEFILVPMALDRHGAIQLAEKIRDIIERHIFVHDIKLTISIGVAEFELHDTPDSWISRADSALYQAKKLGRNNVC